MLAAMSVMALLPSSVQAQFTGFSAVMDTIWHADGADDIDGLEFYGSYSIYAEFTNATDVLSSLYSDVEALGTPAAGIEGNVWVLSVSRPSRRRHGFGTSTRP